MTVSGSTVIAVGSMCAEDTASPAELVNHWSSGLTDEQLREELRRNPGCPSGKDLAPPPETAPAAPNQSFARRGEVNGSSRLDVWDVAVIRSMSRVWGLSAAEIARRRNMPRTTVRDILARRTWTHI